MNVSVIIPAHNEEQYIAGCLKSLLSQEIPADEIIVVDNDSTDRTGEIAKTFSVTVLSEKKLGLTPARNTGFNHARYEIIARTDADSTVPPDWIRKIKQNFETQQIDALSGPIFFYDIPAQTHLYTDIFLKVAKRIFGHPVLIGPNYALTRTMWHRVRSEICQEDAVVHEDIDLAIHIAKKGGIIHIDPTLVVPISGRRILHQPQSFFLEYPKRLIAMLHAHHRLF